MPEYIYEAVQQPVPGELGESVSGSITAETVSQAIAELETQGLVVQSIRQVQAEDDLRVVDSPPRDKATGLRWIPLADHEILQQRIAEVLEQRQVVGPALAAFAEEMPPSRYRRELQSLVARINDGTSAEEICSSPDLTRTWLPLLASGGSPLNSGRLLEEMLTEATQEQEIRRRRWRSWAYPLVVVSLALVVLVFLAIVVIPVFKDIFSDFDLDLPKLTLFLIQLSDAIRFNFLSLLVLVLTAVGTLCLVVWTITTWSPTAEVWGYATRGGSRELTALSSFTLRLAELLRAGVSVPTSLRLAIHGCSRVRLRRAVDQLADSADDHRVGLSDSSIAKVFPSTLVYALEHRNDSDKPSVHLLDELGQLYADRVHSRVNLASGLSSQFAILAMGLLVGIIVLALFVPLVALIEGLTG